MRQLEENQFAGRHRTSICTHSIGTFTESSSRAGHRFSVWL